MRIQDLTAKIKSIPIFMGIVNEKAEDVYFEELNMHFDDEMPKAWYELTEAK